MGSKLKNIFLWLIYGNIFVALAASSLVYLNSYLVGSLDYSITLSIIVFFSTLLAYNFQRLVRLKNPKILPKSNRLIWISTHANALRKINILSIFFIVLISWRLPLKILFLMIPAALISYWYVKGNKKLPPLRAIPYVKIFAIGSTWSFVTFCIPNYLTETNPINTFYFGVVIFLFIVLQTMPFDIRDLEIDKKSNVKTIAQKIGLKRSKWLIIIGLITLLLLVLFGIKERYLPEESIVYGYAALAALPICLKINEKSTEVYYSFIVESILLFPFFFYKILF